MSEIWLKFQFCIVFEFYFWSWEGIEAGRTTRITNRTYVNDEGKNKLSGAEIEALVSKVKIQSDLSFISNLLSTLRNLRVKSQTIWIGQFLTVDCGGRIQKKRRYHIRKTQSFYTGFLIIFSKLYFQTKELGKRRNY